jgi:cytochrome c oxidase subunit 1
MIYALGFIGLFVIGGLTGLFLASMGADLHLTATYFVVAHFHYVMVGGTILAFLGALHFWWPKMFGRMYNDTLGKISALLVFIGFNLTFFPQFILGYLGMPRRYAYYDFAPEWQFWNVMSTAGSSILGIAFLLPAFYLTYSLFKGRIAGPNPWGAKGLEWTIASPPDKHNFHHIPIVTEEAYDYPEERTKPEPYKTPEKELVPTGKSEDK